MASGAETDLNTDFITANEACELLGVKLNTLYSYASRGRLQSYRQGRKRRRYYLRREVEELAGLIPLQPAAADTFRLSLPKAEEWVRYK